MTAAVANKYSIELLSRAREYLACPDCGGAVAMEADTLLCSESGCGAVFPIDPGAAVEMMPRQWPEWGLEAGEARFRPVEAAYRDLCQEPWTAGPPGTGWGDPQSAGSGYGAFIEEHGRQIQTLLGEAAPGPIVDVSGGSGALLRALAGRYEIALHVEGHLPSLAAARRAAGRHAAPNILFVRGCYLNLPIARGAAGTVLCTDTLIRNRIHNRRLLDAVRRILAPGGRALIDCHAATWLRRGGAADVTESFSKDEFRRLLADRGFRILRVAGGGHVPSTRSWSDRRLRAARAAARLLHCPARWMAVVTRDE